MDIEKLIEDLRIACAGNQHNIMGVAATALSTLQIENQALRNAANGFKAENEKLRAELDEKEKYYDQMIDALAATDSAGLEQVKRERDAAVKDLRVCSTENFMECQYCLHRTERSFCGNCKDGSNWEWRGQED